MSDRSHSYTSIDGLIDVKKLIAAYTFEQHVERANAYFTSIKNPWDHILRKPFAESAEARAMLTGLASVLTLAEIYPTQTVLDFGCGAGWLSMVLAFMRCRTIGVDIAEGALEIARNAVAEHTFLSKQDMRFLRLDEARIPLDDESVDRIICFDSFHHVADQVAYLTEFNRILRPGGLAVFHEPGPNHSIMPHSQFEMKQYEVIENDIVVEEIWEAAQELGFDDIRFAAFAEGPFILSLAQFAEIAEERAPSTVYEDFGRRLALQVMHKRIFSLRKAGDFTYDSRIAEMTAGEIVLERYSFNQDQRLLSASLRLKNSGRGTWLPSGTEAGAVNLGAAILTDGGATSEEPMRFTVSCAPVPAGAEVAIEVAAIIPELAGGAFSIRFDLVAEFVAWFSARGMITPIAQINGG